MKYKCDLHVHSYYSDGELSPKQLVDMSIKNKLYAMSLTDHDTIEGLAEADNAAQEGGIKFVSGIELSSYADFEVHILGYNLPYFDSAFAHEISKIAQLRIQRNEEIIKKLCSQGIRLNVGNLFDNGTKGRQHIASLLFEQGYVRSRAEAFDKYIGTHRPCFVKSYRISTKDAIKLIKDYGGVSVVAHPMRYPINTNIKNFVNELVEWGIEGIEVFYSSQPREHRLILSKLANEFDLLMTGGSDFHSSAYGTEIGFANSYLDEITLKALKLL